MVVGVELRSESERRSESSDLSTGRNGSGIENGSGIGLEVGLSQVENRSSPDRSNSEWKWKWGSVAAGSPMVDGEQGAASSR